jgi:hypothetical protein
VDARECLGKLDDLKTVAARVGKDPEKIGLPWTVSPEQHSGSSAGTPGG